MVPQRPTGRKIKVYSMSAKEWGVFSAIVAGSMIVGLMAHGIFLAPRDDGPREGNRGFAITSNPAEGNPSLYESARGSDSTRGSDSSLNSFHSAASRGGKRKTKRKSTKR